MRSHLPLAKFLRTALVRVGNYGASASCVAMSGEQWVSDIITSLVLYRQGSKEMTFPHEKVHSAFVERLLSSLLVALFSVGFWRDHVGNSNTGNDPLSWSPEPWDVRLPSPWPQAEAAGWLPGWTVSEHPWVIGLSAGGGYLTVQRRGKHRHG